MLGWLVLCVLAFCAFVVIGTLVAATSLLGFLIALPVRLLGLLFRGLGLLIGLPFILLGLVIGGLALGVGALVLALPIVPLALLVLAVVWLVKRTGRHAVTS